MRINLKLLLTTLGIVVTVSVSSTLIYYSLTNEILRKKTEKDLSISLNTFTFTFNNFISKIDEHYSDYREQNGSNIEEFDLDFVFTVSDGTNINQDQMKINKTSNLNLTSLKVDEFVKKNPAILLRYQRQINDKYVFYGIVIDKDFLQNIAKLINADILLFQNNQALAASTEFNNDALSSDFSNQLLQIDYSNQGVVYSEFNGIDVFSVKTFPADLKNYNDELGFTIFSASKELAEIRSTMQSMLFVILISGSLLSVIFILLFTEKIRKQINLLSDAAEKVGEGDFNHRVKIISKDEIGKFGLVFNHMLDELAVKEKNEKNYSDFIALINEKPGLKDLAYAALKNIVDSTTFDYGILHAVKKGDSLEFSAAYGVGSEFIKSSKIIDMYKQCIDEQKKIEYKFGHSDSPSINAGSLSLKVKFLTILPIVFHKHVIAVVELGSTKEPNINAFKYINTVEEQLAIGLTNAITLAELENLVKELKTLNFEYQKQNDRISNQNEELKMLHEQLSDKAVELEKQKERAEELTKLKSEFLANMSHELRTPLNSILGLTELVVKDFSTLPKTKNKLGVVLRNGKKLLTLINNILEFSKIELNKNELNKELFSIRNLIKDLISFSEPLINEKKLDFSIQISEYEDLILNTDKSKLEQIFNNLIGNAIKFTENGFVKIEFKTGNNNSLIIDVEDTGIGIDESDLKIIFDEFRQADGTTSRMFGGTGLGLAISKKYTELLGGNLNVESSLGKGTVFTLTIPDVITQCNSNDGDGFIYKSGKDFFEKKVIVANESKSTQKFISDYLASHNVKVVSIENPNEIKSITKSLSLDAIIFDPSSKAGNGWNTIIELLKDSSTSDIPIILARIDEENQIGYSYDAFDFIFDPVNAGKLNHIISKIEAGFDTRVKYVSYITENLEEYNHLAKQFPNISIKYISNSRSAEIILSEDIPDLIITNLFLSDTNAIYQIDKLKQIKPLKNIPIVVIIPEELNDDQIKVLNKSFSDLISKSKKHPLDVLGTIKKKLNIKDSIDLREKLIVDESVEEFENRTGSGKADEIKEENNKLKVLIVDDDEDTLYTVGEIVKDLGYKTVFAHNGIECILALNNITPDLIFLDIMMPKMDGFETIKLIRKDPRYREMPILALTAHAMLENKNVIEKNGFNDIVTKPINTDILLEKIKSYIERV